MTPSDASAAEPLSPARPARRAGATGGRRRRATWFFVLATAVLVLDRLTKAWVMRALAVGEARPLLGDVLELTYRQNTGAAFGLFGSWSVPLIVFTAAVVLVIVVYGATSALRNRLLAAGLALQLGGATGNLWDRLAYGYVVDFLDLSFWPAFNLADMALTVGVALVAWCLLTGPEPLRARGPDPDRLRVGGRGAVPARGKGTAAADDETGSAESA